MSLPKNFFSTFYTIIEAMKKEKIHRILLLLFFVVTICGSLIFFFEKDAAHGSIKTIADGIWWGFVTITTVGYGDKFPVTPSGKLVGIAIMASGMVITIILSGTIASILVDRKMKEGKGLQKVDLKNHILVCGWNDKAAKLLEGFQKIADTNKEKTTLVLVNEQEIDKLNELQFTYATKLFNIEIIRGKYTQEQTLLKACVGKAKSVIVLADTSGSNTMQNADERTIICAYAVTNINPGVSISVELINDQNEQYLKNTNVDNIIVTGEFNSFLLINSAINPGVPQAARELMNFTPGNILSAMDIPGDFIGKEFTELSDYFKNKKMAILVGIIAETKKLSIEDFVSEDPSAIDEFIKRKFAESEKDFFADTGGNASVLVNPGWDYVVKKHDRALVIGEEKSLS